MFKILCKWEKVHRSFWTIQTMWALKQIWVPYVQHLCKGKGISLYFVAVVIPFDSQFFSGKENSSVTETFVIKCMIIEIQDSLPNLN